MAESRRARLLWIDLEMTGLDPARDKIIEVGAIATDFDFHQVADYQASVKVSLELMRRRMVGKFWEEHDITRQALMERSSSAEALPTSQVENRLVDFIKQYFVPDQPVYLAGNSIHQDRKFIEREWRELDKLLHYRMLDVSAWKILFEERGVAFHKPELHRAMSDIEGSIAELKYYLKRVKFDERE